MGNHMVSSIGFPGNRLWARRFVDVLSGKIRPCESPHGAEWEANPECIAIEAPPRLQHTLELGWLLRVVPNGNKGTRCLCSSTSQSLARDTLGRGSFLQPRAILSEGVSVSHPKTNAPASEDEGIYHEDRIWAERQSCHYTWCHKKVSKIKPRDLGFGPGFEKTVCPQTNHFVSMDTGCLNCKIRRLQPSSWVDTPQQ